MTRLDELLRMRDFLDGEIRVERGIVAAAGVGQHRDLVGEIADLYEVDVEELMSPGKGHLTASRARQGLCWALRQTGLSFSQVGSLVGRDHSTVQHACKVIDGDPARRALLAQLVPGERHRAVS